MDEEQRRLIEELLSNEKKSTGIAKSIFSGAFPSDLVFPYPRIPDEDNQKVKGFLSQVSHFAETVIDPESIDRNAEIPQNVIQGLAQLGMLGMTVSQEFGGLGMSYQAYCKSMEIIAARCASTALFINAHHSIGLKALSLFGTKEQKARWLVPLARGEELAAFSLTEPCAGSDAAGIETRAIFDKAKNVYRITGKKQWTTNGSLAHVITVMAKTEVETTKGKQDKVTAFLVTPDMHGFHVTAPALDKVGMRGSRTTNLEFRDMEVPAENILGPIGGGLRVCLTVLDYGRTTFGASCTGIAKFLVERAVQHVKTRYQFKRPLAAFGLVKKKIAAISALAYAMEASTMMTAGLIDRGYGDIMLESALLKVFVSDALWQIIYDTMQLYGGLSFFKDHPFERIMRDARLNSIGEGSNEVLRAFIAAIGMRDVGLELKAFVEALRHPIREKRLLWKFLTKNVSRIKLPKVQVRSPSLNEEANQLSRAVKKFGEEVLNLLKHYREEVIDEQFELERIADAAIAIYTLAAVISRLDASLNDAQLFVVSSQEIDSGKLYCQMAFEKIDNSLNSLFSKKDLSYKRLSDHLTGLATPGLRKCEK